MKKFIAGMFVATALFFTVAFINEYQNCPYFDDDDDCDCEDDECCEDCCDCDCHDGEEEDCDCKCHDKDDVEACPDQDEKLSKKAEECCGNECGCH